MNYPFSSRNLGLQQDLYIIPLVHLPSGHVHSTKSLRVDLYVLFFTSLDLSGMLQGKIQVGYSSNAENAAARKAFLVSIVW